MYIQCLFTVKTVCFIFEIRFHNTMNMWEYLHTYKHKTNNALIEEQIHTNTTQRR